MNKIMKVMDIARDEQKLEHDCVFIICGMEGSGKSHLALHCVEHLGGKIQNITLGQKEFVNSLKTVEDCDVLDFDEAGDGLFSRDHWKESTKDLVKAFMVIRAKRLITFLVLPSFFMLDVYFRKHRIMGLFYVVKRGKVKFYNRNGIEKIILRSEKTQKITGRPSFTDTYPPYTGRLLEEYKIKKNKKVDETLKNAGHKEIITTKAKQIRQLILKGKSTSDIAKEMLVDVSVVSHERAKMAERLSI